MDDGFMITREDLDSLTSAQLHDRAIGSAKAAKDIEWSRFCF